MRIRYEPLARAVDHRADLTYVIGEMIGELNSGHTYIGGGSLPQVPKIKVGMLGARFERDPKTRFYRIAKILKGQNWDNTLRSPLTEAGVNVKEGEFVIAINARLTSEMTDMYEAPTTQPGNRSPCALIVAPKKKAAGRSSSSPSRRRIPSIIIPGSRTISKK